MAEKVRFGICGAGRRGGHLTKKILCALDAVEIVAICDHLAEKADLLADEVNEITGVKPAVYTSHLELMEQESVDALLVATSIDTHTQISIDAMERGVIVGMEVGGAAGEEECWRLLNAFERTQTPFMFLENCCYGKAELFAASLKKHGVLGDVVYCHGSYMHDIRELICTGEGSGTPNFRWDIWKHDNADSYPTHELGPISKILNIGRGNRMVSLSSRASSAKGLKDYISRTEELAHLRDHSFQHGDIVETLINCENGELINLRLDCTLPTYYSREITVRGTKGHFRQDGNILVVDGNHHKYFNDAVDSADPFYDEYLPDVWKNIPSFAREAGHGGIDYLMMKSFVEAIRNQEEMPIDIYDAVTWMSIGYLSRKSIENGGSSVEIPDFTKGAYKTRPPRDVVDL